MNLSNPISSLIPSLEGQVLRTLARSTAGFTGAQVARVSSTGSEAGMRNALERLAAQGIVAAQPVGGSIVYRIERQHVLWPALETLIAAADGVLPELETRMAGLVEQYLPAGEASHVTIALYGSVARGDSTQASDVDVVVVFADSADALHAVALVDALTASVVAWTGNACNVYDVRASGLTELVERADPLVDSWLAEARTIHGSDLTQRLRKTH